jgi:hypothetical protein
MVDAHENEHKKNNILAHAASSNTMSLATPTKVGQTQAMDSQGFATVSETTTTALTDVTNTTTTASAEKARFFMTTELSEHLLKNEYVKLDGVEEYVLRACERNDLEFLKLIRAGSELSLETRLAGAKRAKEHGHNDCAAYLRLDDSVCMKKAKKSRAQQGARQTKDVFKDIENVDDLIDRLTNGTASGSYRRAYEDAVGGQGLRMAYGGDAEFGEDDCLKDAPLNPRSLESVELWLAETQKVSRRAIKGQYDSYGQGILNAVLGHLKRVLG